MTDLREWKFLAEWVADQRMDLTLAESREALGMLRGQDEGALVEFFNDRVEGGLNPDGCIQVSNLLADFADLNDQVRPKPHWRTDGGP